MSSSFGHNLRIQLFGQSHSRAIGLVMDGLPAGLVLDMDRIKAMLQRRAPGQAAYATARKERDLPTILAGQVEGKTCGAPLAVIFDNEDVRSGDYDDLRFVPRPGHADYTAYVKTGGQNDHRGGGHFSARLTAPLVFAGAVCALALEDAGIFIGAHIASIGPVSDDRLDPVAPDLAALARLRQEPFPTLNREKGQAMEAAIAAAREEGDSLGGVVACCASGLPPGLGQPPFQGLENLIAAAIFAIPAVRGIEFGSGFEAAAMKGSQHNDPFCWEGEAVRTQTNHHGGILGGLASGMPLLFRTAFKPTPSIGLPQASVHLTRQTQETLTIKGRHDPCVVPRAVPCVEAATAIAIYDLLLGGK